MIRVGSSFPGTKPYFDPPWCWRRGEKGLCKCKRVEQLLQRIKGWRFDAETGAPNRRQTAKIVKQKLRLHDPAFRRRIHGRPLNGTHLYPAAPVAYVASNYDVANGGVGAQEVGTGGRAGGASGRGALIPSENAAYGIPSI